MAQRRSTACSRISGASTSRSARPRPPPGTMGKGKGQKREASDASAGGGICIDEWHGRGERTSAANGPGEEKKLVGDAPCLPHQLGQIIATKTDMLGPVYTEVLGRLHDKMPYVPVKQVRKLLRK